MSEKAPSLLTKEKSAELSEYDEATPASYADVVAEIPELAAVKHQVDSLATREEEYSEGYERKIRQFGSVEEVKAWMKQLQYALPDTIDAQSGEPKIDVQMWDGGKGDKGEYVTVQDPVRKLLFVHGIDSKNEPYDQVISFPDGAGGFYELSEGEVAYTTGKGTENEYTEGFKRDYAQREKKLKLNPMNKEKTKSVSGFQRYTRSAAVNKALGMDEKIWTSAESSIVDDRHIDDERQEEFEKRYIELASQARGALETIFEEIKDEAFDAIREQQKIHFKELSRQSVGIGIGDNERRELSKLLKTVGETDRQ